LLPELIFSLGRKVFDGGDLTFEEALELGALEGSDLYFLFAVANKVREKHSGKRVEFCAIVNARSGRCSEDCAFCAQSAHHRTEIDVYPLLPGEEILRAAKEAEKRGVDRFSIVTSGKGVKGERNKDFAHILEAVKKISSQTGLKVCCSLGLISFPQARALKQAGVTRYHHNLETSASFYKEICTTHTYAQRVETIKIARQAGLECCAGGIIGMGETMAQRIELAFALKELGVASIPINILHPIKGTRLEAQKPLPPLEILKTIAIFRLILPDKQLRYAGGREVNLRSLQALGLACGINSLLTGDYLTTPGQGTELDSQMVADLGLERVW